MREILFKAKRLGIGEWVEGSIFQSGKDKNTAVIIHEIPGCCEVFKAVVDAVTVCQCTGFTDVKGKKIFENDIIKFRRAGGGAKEFIGQVIWAEKYGAFFITNSDVYDNAMYEFTKFEVIGNIYDNPTLLGKA